jgi:hypothetical protein
VDDLRRLAASAYQLAQRLHDATTLMPDGHIETFLADDATVAEAMCAMGQILDNPAFSGLGPTLSVWPPDALRRPLLLLSSAVAILMNGGPFSGSSVEGIVVKWNSSKPLAQPATIARLAQGATELAQVAESLAPHEQRANLRPIDRRNRLLYDLLVTQGKGGRKATSEANALAAKEGWETLDSPRSVYKVVKVWAASQNPPLPYPPRKPRRRGGT